MGKYTAPKCNLVRWMVIETTSTTTTYHMFQAHERAEAWMDIQRHKYTDRTYARILVTNKDDMDLDMIPETDIVEAYAFNEGLNSK